MICSAVSTPFTDEQRALTGLWRRASISCRNMMICSCARLSASSRRRLSCTAQSTASDDRPHSPSKHCNKSFSNYHAQPNTGRTVWVFLCSLGSAITDEGSKPEMLSRIAHTTAALTRLKAVWNERSISLSSKIWLMRSLVTSIFLYMLVNHGPLQQSSTEECKAWKWGANARYYTSHTKTMLPTRESVPRSSRQLDHMKISWRS